MGRKGDMLRAAKKQTTSYVITGKWLEDHDRQVIENYKRDIEGRMMKTANEYVRNYFDKIGEEFVTPDLNENFMNAVAYMFAIPCRVLIEQFGWKPVRFANCPQTKTEKLAIAMIEELNNISSNTKQDIRSYARETFEKYGLKFVNDFVFNEGETDDV